MHATIQSILKQICTSALVTPERKPFHIKIQSYVFVFIIWIDSKRLASEFTHNAERLHVATQAKLIASVTFPLLSIASDNIKITLIGECGPRRKQNTILLRTIMS